MTPIFFLVGILAMTCLVLTANAQVEVKQSVTTNDNGQKTSIKTDSKAPANICQGLPSACDSIHCLGMFKDCFGSSVFMQLLQGGTVKITEKPGTVIIHYCSQAKECHSYRLDNNGTITEVK